MGEGGCQKINIFVLYNMWTTPMAPSVNCCYSTVTLNFVILTPKFKAFIPAPYCIVCISLV